MVFRPHLGVIDRLAMVEHEVREYSEGRVGFTSIGTRLALWHASIDLAERNLWFGMGVHRFREGLSKLREEGRFPADARLYDHAHNTYLSLLVEVGIAGLVAFAAAVALLLRALWALPRPSRALGVSLLACLAVFAMTNDVLAHQNLIRVAVLSFACCLGARRLPSSSVLETSTPVRKARSPAVVVADR
jgi:O-antigen ligase